MSVQELVQASEYKLAVVSRHDILLGDGRLPRELLIGPRDDEVWMLQECGGHCHPVPGRGRVPKDCKLTGRFCPERTIGRQQRNQPGMVYKDWLFAGSSHVVARMGDTIRSFVNYTALLTHEWAYSHTHSLWPLHVTRLGFKIRWELDLHPSRVRQSWDDRRSKWTIDPRIIDLNKTQCYFKTTLSDALPQWAIYTEKVDNTSSAKLGHAARLIDLYC